MLSYFEMLEEDQPPREIWLDDDALEAHFVGVKARREQRSGGRGTEQVPEMRQNELTKGLR